MTYLFLFLEFFKTGLFAIGGGLATIPFLMQMTYKYEWFTQAQLADMIAIAESTPGPIGVNVATFAGFQAGGVLGALTSTFGLVLPSYIVICIIFKILQKFREAPLTNNLFYGIRPTVAGLIISACASLFNICMINQSYTGIYDFFNLKALALFGIFTFLVLKFKKLNPILIIVLGAIAGIILKMA